MLTLGINYSQMHDSSACIVRDGELLFAVAEERISRLKTMPAFLKRHSSMSGFCESESRTVGRTVFRLADGGAGLSARSEMLRHREDTGDIPQRVEFDIALPEHVASGKWGKEIRAAIRADAREDAVCRSSPRSRHQRVRVLGIRRGSGCGHGWPGRVGSDDDLAWAQRQGST